MHEDAVRVVDGEFHGAGEVRAGRFTLVDRHGNVRAAFGVGEDGSPTIQLLDPGDQPRMLLALEANGAANVKLLDAEGDVRVWLSVSPNGAPSLYLRGTSRYAEEGTGHAELAIDEHGCPALSLCDTGGQPRLLLGLDEKGGMPRLSLSSADGDLRALLIADRERGTLHLYPEQGARDDVPTLRFRPESSNGTAPARPAGVVTPLEPPVAAAVAPAPPPIAPVAAPAAATQAARPREPIAAPAPRRARGRRYLRATVPLLVLAVAGLGAASYHALTAPAPEPAIERLADSAPTRDGRTVEAEEFVLRGPGGATHARLGLLPDGSPFLQLTGNGGRSSAELSVLPSQGPVLKLSDGKSLVSLRAKSDGSSEITLHGQGQEPRASLFLDTDGNPVLSMTDAAGHVRAGLTISADGSPSLSLYDDTTLRAMLHSAGSSSTLSLLDEHGRVVYTAPPR